MTPETKEHPPAAVQESAQSMHVPAQVVHFGLLDVQVALQLQDISGGVPVSARSGLRHDGGRGINIWVSPSHLLISRALSRADALTLRFLIGISLVEFCGFWGGTRDGAAVNRSLKRIAGIPLGAHAYGCGFASHLAICETLRAVDSLPIFSRSPQVGPFNLFRLVIEGRSPSDIKNWMIRDDQTEDVRPMPKAVRNEPKAEPAVVAPTPDSFLTSFHGWAKELLSKDDYNIIVEMAHVPK